jgi:P-type Cu+ transporter
VLLVLIGGALLLDMSPEAIRDRSVSLVAGVLVDQRRAHRGVPHAAHQLSCAGPGHRGELVTGVAQVVEVEPGVTCFALAGRLWEATARRAAGSALRALAARTAREATRLDPDGTEQRIPAAALRVGDRFLVRPGELIAADGVVTDGACAVDTSALTGESQPTAVRPGGRVTGGSVVLDGRLEVTATGVGAETTWAQLVGLVERAQHDKAAIARLTDRISAVFVPAVVALAAATAVVWLLVGADPQRAAQAGIAVLIIACPCALGLATPTGLLVASGRGAELGVFLKGHHGLEVAGAIDTVVLDKTGTLTTGMMQVVGMTIGPGSDPDTLLRLTSGCGGGSPASSSLRCPARPTPAAASTAWARAAA